MKKAPLEKGIVLALLFGIGVSFLVAVASRVSLDLFLGPQIKFFPLGNIATGFCCVNMFRNDYGFSLSLAIFLGFITGLVRVLLAFPFLQPLI